MTNEEINKAIAEKVMKFITKYEGEYYPYSTDIRYAWQVVEKMRKKGWLFEIGCTPLGGWYVDISAYDAKGNQILKAIVANQDSGQLAICLAALKAVS